jgi:hypothetical protein
MGNWKQTGGIDLTGTPPQSNAVSPGTYRFKFTPAQALTGATPVTLTLSPFPSGIKAGSVTTPHYIRITDSVAGNENVLITARTSSTVTFTPALSHVAGNWSIGSATYGIQEAIKYVEGQPQGGAVELEFGISFVYATIYFAGAPGVAVQGNGWWCTEIGADASTGDIFLISGATQLVQLRDFHIARNVTTSSGAAIHVKDMVSESVVLHNIKVENVAIGVDIENSNGVTAIGYNYVSNQSVNPSAFAGVWVHGTRGGNIIFTGGDVITEGTPDSAAMLDYGFLIETADGICVSDFQLRGEYSIYVHAASGAGVGTVLFTGCVFDNGRVNNIRIVADAGAAYLENVGISNSHIISAGITSAVGAENVYISNNTGDPAFPMKISITGSFIEAAKTNGMTVNNVRGLALTGNHFTHNGVIAGAGYGLVITGTARDMAIVGNAFYANATGSINNTATMTNSVIDNNSGVVTSANMTVIAAAATIAIPANGSDMFFVTPTGTAIATINGARGGGHTIEMLMTGAVNFSGGNTTTFGPTVNGQRVTGVFVPSTSVWYLK